MDFGAKHSRTRGRSWRVAAATMAAVVAAGLAAAPVANAQIPSLPLPPLPEVPPEVQQLIETAEDTVVPVLVEVAVEVQILANAVGFLLRPGCALTGTAVLLVTLAGGTLPISPGFLSTPLLIVCAGAFAEGPADPVFDQVDELAGEQLADAVNPVLAQATEAMAPVQAEVQDVCGVIGLLGSAPRQVPKPFHRFDFVRVLCG